MSTLAGSLMFIMQKYCAHIRFGVKHNGAVPNSPWGIHGLNGWGIYGSNGWGSYGKVGYCFWEIRLKNTGLQGSTLSGHRMTMGFGRFELPTCNVL